MNLLKKIVLGAASCLLVNASQAQSISYQSGPGDLRAGTLRAAPDVPLANTRREAVSFTMPASRNAQASTREPFVARSREYRTEVSAQQLRNGVGIRTTGAGAVIALSPLSSAKGAGLNPLDMTISTSDGRQYRGSDGMDQFVDQRAVEATGVPFSNGMVGFRLNRELGAGRFTVQATGNVPATGYQLLVLDAQGSAELSLSAPEQTLVGQSFVASGQFSDTSPVTLKSANAFLLAPDGQRLTASVVLNGNEFAVTSRAAHASSFDAGLWELHVTATDGSGLQRDVKTALSAAYPTARFDGSVQRSQEGFDVGVEAASAGRYEVSAVLYGTTETGLIPIATSATAQWIERGVDTVSLRFDADTLKASGAQAPFVLRSVTLKDQSRLAILELVSSTTSF